MKEARELVAAMGKLQKSNSYPDADLPIQRPEIIRPAPPTQEGLPLQAVPTRKQIDKICMVKSTDANRREKSRVRPGSGLG